MKVEYFLATLLATILIIVPQNLAESDVTVSFPIDVPDDIALKHQSPQLADNSYNAKQFQDQKVHSFSPNLNNNKKIKAYSAVLLIKPVEINSNWESEFSSIIADNLVDRDSSIKRKEKHGLKRIIRKSEALHKLVVVPMANSITSLKSLAHIIKSRAESSLFPKEMAMPELVGIPQIIKIIPNGMSYKELKRMPENYNNLKELNNATKLDFSKEGLVSEMKPTEASNEKSLVAPLVRKYILTRPSQPISITATHSLLENESKTSDKESIMKTDETEFTQNVAPSQTELENLELEKELRRLLNEFDKTHSEIVTQSPVNNTDKNAPIDINIYKALSNKELRENDDNEYEPRNIHNVVYLRRFPKFTVNELLKPESGDPVEHHNLFQSFISPSVTDNNKPSKIQDLNVEDFHGIIKTEGFPISENMIKSSYNQKFDSHTAMSVSNVLENYPPRFRFSPVHVHREEMRMEDLPIIEEILDKSGSEFFQKPVTFFRGKPFPKIRWDEVYNEIEGTSIVGNNFG